MNRPRPYTIAGAGIPILICSAVIWHLCRTQNPPLVERILLISIDTCRADYLGCYGQKRALTPHIDDLASDGIRFENVISPAPLTLPSHCSMLTGTNPVYHGVHDNLDYVLGDDILTLPEILHSHGFISGAMVSAYVLDSQFGLAQGFDSYDDEFQEERLIGNMSERVGSEAARLAIDWLHDHHEDRFFYFLHFYDPHHEYEPPELFASRFADDPYAGEIAFTDHCIGQVLNELKRLAIYDSTLIILTADHGEMLGEHGELGHSYFIYQSAIRVPLIIKLPRQTGAAPDSARVVSQLAGLVDIVPTVCGLLNVAAPDVGQGMDLTPNLLGDRPPVERYVYCESLTPTKYQANSLLGVVGSKWKFIQTTRPEFYNLAEDPAESRNLAEEEPTQAEELKSELVSFLEQSSESAGDSSGAIDLEGRRRLESLGYVSGAEVEEEFAFDSSKPDPKDALRFHHANDKIQKLILEGDYESAKSLCMQAIEENPHVFLFQYSMGRIANQLQDFSQAADCLHAAVILKSDSPEVQHELGLALRGAGRLEDARQAFQDALRLNPEFAEAHASLGVTMAYLGDPNEAIAHCRQALALQPDVAATHNNLGVMLASQGQNDEAIIHYRRAIELDPEYFEAYINLGAASASLANLTQAVEQYEQALAIEPNAVAAHVNLAGVLEQLGRTDEAIEHYRTALRSSPEAPELHSRIAKAYQANGQAEEALKSLRVIMRISPDSDAAHYNLANQLAAMQRWEEAIEHFLAAVRLNPQNAGAHTNLGNVLSSLGKFDEATEHYQRSLQINPDSAYAYYNLALCHVAQDRMTEALENYEHVLRLQPDWNDALNAVAWILATHWDDAIRDPDRALELAKRAAEATNCQDAAILDTLAAAYAAQGDFDKAIEIVNQAIDLLPANAGHPLRQGLNTHLDLYKSSQAYVGSPSPVQPVLNGP